MMKISTDVEEPTDEIYEVDHDVWISRKAREMGFPVAGTIRDIYLDAVVLIPPMFKFDWKADRIKIGRVLEIQMGGYEVATFIIQLEDGTQVPCSYGLSYDCFFALPEDSEGFCR